MYPGDQLGGFIVMDTMKVGTDPDLEDFGYADIQDFPVLNLHDKADGFIRQQLQFFCNMIC